ncbi:MAG: FIST signal transduction protein [Bradymonadia bacterium]
MSEQQFKSSATTETETDKVVSTIAADFEGIEPAAIVFFCSHTHDGAAISGGLKATYPEAEIIGCTTAGEFTEKLSVTGAVTAMAIPNSRTEQVVAALVKHEGKAADGVKAAAQGFASKIGEVDLRSLDPGRWVGVVLIDGLHGSEEQVNAALGEASPLLNFVGGSAGDNLAFQSTQVFYNGESTDDGTALLLMEMSRPFEVVKTCSFTPMGKTFTITKADEATRTVYEFDGRPAVEAYAEALGVTPEQIDGSIFMRHPVGIMLEDKPWIRSPQQQADNGGIKFYCSIIEGMEVSLMQSTDLVAETRRALTEVARQLSEVNGILGFNCILRRLEMDSDDTHGAFTECFDAPTAGFHTYGESWLGHINQTLTAIVFS